MATAPIIGQNRAYYLPGLFGLGGGADAAGTPALAGSGDLNALMAALLANFNPSLGTQRVPMSMDMGGGSDSFIPGAGGGTVGGEIPVDPVNALGTLGTVSNLAGTAGMLGQLTGNPAVSGIANILGTVAGAGETFYSDAARDQITNQTNRDLEMAGLVGNYDLGRSGYDPSLAAASKIAPMIGMIAGANPIFGGLAREGLMMAADPVPSTTGDLVRAGVDAVVPGIINAIITGLTGSTIGTNMKGAMTPVEETIARTPDEIAREEALGGRTAAGAPVETIVPTPVENIPAQDEATVNALIDAMAAASEPAPTGLGAIAADTIARDLNFAESQSVRGPVLNTEPEAAAGNVTPPAAPGIFDFFKGVDLSGLARGFSIPLSLGASGGLASSESISMPPPAPPVAPPPSTFDNSPETVNAIFDAMADYQQMMETESSMGSSAETPSTDYSGLSDFEMSYT